ncbi:MAG: stage II sporulation protein R [Clostridia bacterium]|nr:stage II sporulation protein R [Clostridia bacterium]
MLRKRFAIAISILLFTFLMYTAAAGFVGAAKADIPEDLIRFHVIAHSDKPGDQKLKIQVRDAILEEFGQELGNISEVDEARRLVLENLQAIKDTARKEILTRGKNYPVKVELGEFNFPTKTYGSFSLPSGEYEAVRVVIGSGEGKNWWCVLFPPLCFVDISNNVAVEPKAAEVYKDSHLTVEDTLTEDEEIRVEIRFKFMEMLKKSRDLLVASRDRQD